MGFAQIGLGNHGTADGACLRSILCLVRASPVVVFVPLLWLDLVNIIAVVRSWICVCVCVVLRTREEGPSPLRCALLREEFLVCVF